MRYWLLTGIILISCLTTVHAQYDGIVSTEDLTVSLEKLKNTSDSARRANEQLVRDNQALQQEIGQWQLKLGQLDQEQKALAKARLKLGEKNEGRAKQVALSQKELYDLDVSIDKLQQDITAAQDRLVKIKQEENNLSDQLSQVEGAPVEAIADPVEDPQAVNKRKEKINLLKMVDQSQQRQEQLTLQLAELKPAGPASDLVELMASRQALQAHLDSLKEQLNTLAANNTATGDVDNEDVAKLSHEMTVLENNYDELKLLWSKMQDKAQNLKMDPDDMVEKAKLAKSLSDLSRESGALQSELQSLREQMVELDKRKTRLQSLLTP